MFESFQACFDITCKLRINVKSLGPEPGLSDTTGITGVLRL